MDELAANFLNKVTSLPAFAAIETTPEVTGEGSGKEDDGFDSGSSGKAGEASSNPFLDTAATEIYCQVGSKLVADVIQLISNGGDVEEALEDDDAPWANNATSTVIVVTANSTDYCAKNVVVSDGSLASIVLVMLASLCVVALTCTQRRRYAVFTSTRYDSRPAVLRPFPIIEPCRMRFNYAAFWATVAYDGIQFLTSPKELIITTTCMVPWMKPLIILINVHIYAILYFPIIGGMSTDTPIGYMMATAYVWALTVFRAFDIVDVISEYKSSPGVIEEKSELVLDIFTAALPIISMLYLCLALPFHLCQGLRLVSWFSKTSMYDPLNPKPAYRNTPQGQYVTQLFRTKTIETAEPPKGMKKVLDKVYPNIPYFRYSQVILSTITVGFVFIYYIIVADASWIVYVGKFLPLVFEMIDTVIRQFYRSTALATQVGTTFGVSNASAFIDMYEEKTKWFEHMAHVYVWGAYYCHIAAVALAAITQCILLVTLLTRYRDDMTRAYRGCYGTIRPPQEISARGLIGGTVRYMGTQAVMFAWGTVVQIAAFTALAIAIGFIIVIPLAYGFGDWLLIRIERLLPAFAVTIALIIVHMLVSAFCFTAEPCGKVLSVKNPKGFSNYAYISFYKNLFVGIVGALLRLFLSMITGAIVFSRIDMPTITPAFRFLDSGFKAYEALIHVENAHTNPTMMTFANILLEEGRKRRKWRNSVSDNRDTRITSAISTSSRNRVAPAASSEPASSSAAIMTIPDSSKAVISGKRIARKWALYRTLLMNPQLVSERKAILSKLTL